ncbi:hypothetical protein [Paenibacillus sp. UNC451MF]|uniref:hypothetical protein n=1 Tax=Paenibacillus sp. UNC451MF TaxID=1449063 RepID=UPI00048FC3A7|nr:hypothetical protein [Paenibacillus sp. UNC451MF]
MKLIQLLLNNWVFLVIIFIILSNVGKMLKSRSSNETGKQAPPKQGMPPFAGGGGSGSGWGRTIKQTVTQTRDVITRSEQPKTQSKPKPQERTQRAQMALQDLETEDVWKDSPLESNRNKTSVKANRQQLQQADSEQSRKQLSTNQLAQGVIWAEILGPPRAKKPFRK